MSDLVGMKWELSTARAEVHRLANSAPMTATKALYTSAMHVLVPEMKKQIKANGSVFRGELHQRLTAKAEIGDKGPQVEVGAFGVPYALNVEQGTPPHTPDINKIKDYVSKKMGVEASRVDFVAALVSRAIETRGTIPHPYLAPVWNREQRRFFDDFVGRMKEFFGET